MSQDIIVFCVVIGAVIVLAKKIRISMRKMAQGTCGGCSGCETKAATSCQMKSSEQISFQI